MSFSAAELIQKKKQKIALTAEEIYWLIGSYAKDLIPDYQMAAWAMAVYFNGMSDDEVSAFTKAMRDSGDVFDFSSLNAPRIDKHSTGGVGDKTSLIIGPIWAAANIYTPMIAGRGLGHTGGTLDKLESIPGFNIHLNKEQFENNVRNNYFSLMGQTKEICPADRKLYALRDVTSTVDSLPLICGSIMSKKLAEDLTGLVLDVKCGSGAFMKNLDMAEALGRLLKFSGEKNGVSVHVLISNMDQPLGSFAGNSLEVYECVEILRGERKKYTDTYELSLQLAAHGIFLAKKADSIESAYSLAQTLVANGKAYEAFEKWLSYQGPADIENLPRAKYQKILLANESGYLNKMKTEGIGWATVALGVGRAKTTDSVDPAAGIEFIVKPGQKVEKSQPLMKLYCSDQNRFEGATKIIEKSLVIESTPQEYNLPLIAKVLT